MNNPEYVKVDGIKYKINTDYKAGLKCQKVSLDTSIGDYERAMAIIYILFGDEGFKCTNKNKLIELGFKYLSCGEDIKHDKSEEVDMDMIQDFKLIQASFKSDYGIDIDKENIHWWDFMAYLNGLTDKCVLNRVREIRTYDISEIKDTKEKNKLIKMKEHWALKKEEKPLTEEQEKSVDNFYKLTGLKRKE